MAPQFPKRNKENRRSVLVGRFQLIVDGDLVPWDTIADWYAAIDNLLPSRDSYMAVESTQAGQYRFLQAALQVHQPKRLYVAEASVQMDGQCRLLHRDGLSAGQLRSLFHQYYQGHPLELAGFQDISEEQGLAWQANQRRLVKEDGTVILSDRRLHEAINKLRGLRPLTPVTLAELQRIKAINCKGVAAAGEALDLQPLMLASSLKTLNASSNVIKDFTPIGACKQLVTLSLSGTNVKDLRFLTGLSQLRALFLEETNELEHMECLYALPSLKSLHISEELARAADLKNRLPQVSVNPPRREKRQETAQSQSLHKQVEQALRRRDWARAVTLYKGLLEQEPSPALYKSLSSAYKMMGQADQAVISLEQRFVLFPDEPGALEEVKKIYRETQNYWKIRDLAAACLSVGRDPAQAKEELEEAEQIIKLAKDFPICSILPLEHSNMEHPAFQALIHALGADKERKPSKSQHTPHTKEALISSFFYQDFTEKWPGGTSMRPVYRGELESMLRCAHGRERYEQEDGERGLSISFDGKWARLSSQNMSQNLKLRAGEYQRVLAHYVRLYLDKYHALAAERTELEQLLQRAFIPEEAEKDQAPEPNPEELDTSELDSLTAHAPATRHLHSDKLEMMQEVGQRLRAAGEWERAVPFLLKAAYLVEAGLPAASVYEALGDCYRNLRQERLSIQCYQKAYLFLEQSRHLLPEKSYLQGKVLFLHRCGLYHHELDALNQGAERDSFWYHYHCGEAYTYLNQPEQALLHFRKAEKKKPEDMLLCSMIGWNYISLEEFTTARDYLRHAKALGREDYWLFTQLGFALSRTGEYAQSIACYQQALLCVSPEDIQRRGYAMEMIGYCQLMRKRVYDAIDQMEHALQLGYTSDQLLGNLAAACRRANLLEKAAKYWAMRQAVRASGQATSNA